MTAQISDTCMFDGRQWEIHNDGTLSDVIPTSESLGFTTVPASTANWSGRIDHYLVYRDSLYLHKIEVNLDKAYRHFTPEGAGRELVVRYELTTKTDSQGARKGWRKHRFIYFVFGAGNLRICYTGEIELLYPYIDLWNIPAIDDEEDDVIYEKHVTLQFEQGTLIGVRDGM